MRLFIQIEIGDWQQSGYDKPWLHFASSLSSDLMGTDLDNQSESLVADLVLKLIDQSDEIFLLVESHDPNAPTGAAERVIRYSLERTEQLAMLVLSGDHRQVEAIAAGFAGKFIKESREQEIKELIWEFAQ